MSETDLQRSILQALETAGYWAFRVNTGGRGAGKLRLAPAGTPDICCVSPPGWLEVKLPGKAMTQAQVLWHARAMRLGVRVEIVDSVDDALTIVGDWTSQDAAKDGVGLELKRIAESLLGSPLALAGARIAGGRER